MKAIKSPDDESKSSRTTSGDRPSRRNATDRIAAVESLKIMLANPKQNDLASILKYVLSTLELIKHEASYIAMNTKDAKINGKRLGGLRLKQYMTAKAYRRRHPEQSRYQACRKALAKYDGKLGYGSAKALLRYWESHDFEE